MLPKGYKNSVNTLFSILSKNRKFKISYERMKSRAPVAGRCSGNLFWIQFVYCTHGHLLAMAIYYSTWTNKLTNKQTIIIYLKRRIHKELLTYTMIGIMILKVFVVPVVIVFSMKNLITVRKLTLNSWNTELIFC